MPTGSEPARSPVVGRPPAGRRTVLRRRLAAVVATAAALALPAGASAAATGTYDGCPPTGDAVIVEVSAASCEDAAAVAVALTGVAPADSAAVVTAAGWSPVRAATAGGEQYDLVAIRGRAALRIRRPGAVPDLDGWAAGRELLLARGTLIPGGRPPRGAVLCTSAFLVRVSGRLGGLSAAHCGGLRRDGTTQRRNAALRRPPQPGIIVGRVTRNLWRRARSLDALVLPAPLGADRPASAVVNRGVLRPPWFVAGTARPLLGRKVCFTGRTSGVDQCGRIVRSFPGIGLPCTSITAREGDSGGPVYTAPRADGTVRAVGVTTLVYGLLQSMCFTPIGPVLRALDAQLVTAAAA